VGVWARQGDTWLAATDGPRATVDESVAPPEGPMSGGDWRNPPGTVLGVFPAGATARWWDPSTASGAGRVDRRLAPDETRTVAVAFRPAGEAPGPEPTVEVRVVHRRGPVGAGVETTPWEMRPNDAPPVVEWARIVR
jgi:hypothetical protein